MYVMKKTENNEIKEIEKEAVAEDIKKALETQEQIEQPVSNDAPAPVGTPKQAQEPEGAESLKQEEAPKSSGQPKQAKPHKPPMLPKPSTLAGRIKKLGKKNGILLILVELILVLFLAVILSQHISLNSDEPGQRADSGFVDEISCSDGQLTVNTVSVKVPADGGVSYSISYDWGKDDKEYPTVPKAAIASYPAEGGDLKYDISLYRESFTPSKKVPEGKNPSNWFADWKTVNNEYSKQGPKKSGDINGFMISTVGNDPEGAYESSSFYFAVGTKEGVSVYVVEGLLYDKAAEKEFSKVIEDVIKSVKTKKQAA